MCGATGQASGVCPLFFTFSGVPRRLAAAQGANRNASGLIVKLFHEPAMVAQVLEYLGPERGGVFLDGTVGAGGHADALLQAAKSVRLLGVDKDGDALAATSTRLKPYGDRVELRQGDYADADELFGLGEGMLAGVLVDLGVSSHQIDSVERGFSFRPGVPLDMRMSREGGESTAADLLGRFSTEELAEVFRVYGEERRANRLAAEIVRKREGAPLKTSDDLLAAVEAVWRGPVTTSDKARLFQAVRIAVNRELESLDRGLPALRDLLAPAGRMVVISYHSLEDRRVKRAFRDWSRECVCPPGLPECRCRGRSLGRGLTRRVVRPVPEEVLRNPRSRSARLRAWERGE